MSGPGSENSFAQSASEMNIPSQYDNKDFGKKSKTVARKIVIRSTGTDKKMYGARAIMTKENEEDQPKRVTLIEYLIAESDDLSLLPDSVIGEIKKNIRTGAKDLEQKWKNALELVHKAYHVANIRRPTPDQKGAWKQYEELIKFGVRQLSACRGLDGEWRMSNVMIREQANVDRSQEISKRRFFVEVPGESAKEVAANDMGELIDGLINNFRRHSAKVRVEERNKNGAILSVWKNDVQIEKIVIKELS